MSRKWKARNESAYFCTITVVDWIKIFNDETNCDIILSSLEFCQTNKNLEVFSYCLMPDHLHLLVRTRNSFSLPQVVRDFKKYTTKKLLKKFEKEKLQTHFTKNGRNKLWQQGYHAIEVYSPNVIKQKLNYIHMNPVRAGIVDSPLKYRWSSARNYAELDYELVVTVLKMG